MQRVGSIKRTGTFWKRAQNGTRAGRDYSDDVHGANDGGEHGGAQSHSQIQPCSRRREQQDRCRLANTTFLGDMVEVVQLGASANTFHWHDDTGNCRGMLTTLRSLLHAKYGADNIVEHMELLDRLEKHGNPRVWAFLWILFSTTDVSLQCFLAGVNDEWMPPPPTQTADVEKYIGTDGLAKKAFDPWALQNYLGDVSDALRTYVWDGLRAEDKQKLYMVITSAWMYGGVAIRR